MSADNATQTVLDKLNDMLDELTERLDRIDEALSNISTPGGNYSFERYDDEDED